MLKKENEKLPDNPTDALIRAIETADSMSDVLVIYKLKSDKHNDHDGVGWISTLSGTGAKLGLIEEFKILYVAERYGLIDDD